MRVARPQRETLTAESARLATRNRDRWGTYRAQTLPPDLPVLLTSTRYR